MKPDEEAVHGLFHQHRHALERSMPMALRQEILSQAGKSRTPVSAFAWMWAGGGALAACVALLLSFQLGRLSVEGGESPDSEIVAAHVRSLMATHLYDVRSTDQHTVKPWFEGKMDFAPVVKDFADAGFPLEGGRLDYLHGRPEAALVFRKNQHLINLFQHPTDAADSLPKLTLLRGFQIFTWVRSGMSFTAISDVNAADLQRFVELWQ